MKLHQKAIVVAYLRALSFYSAGEKEETIKILLMTACNPADEIRTRHLKNKGPQLPLLVPTR
jgi:hypothetical protein